MTGHEQNRPADTTPNSKVEDICGRTVPVPSADLIEATLNNRQQFLLDIIGQKPGVFNEEEEKTVDVLQTEDLMIHLFDMVDVMPNTATMLWARRAAFHILDGSFEDAQAIYVEYNQEFEDTLGPWDEAIDDFTDSIAVMDEALYDKIELCTELIAKDDNEQTIVRATMVAMCMQIAFHQAIEQSRDDESDPIASIEEASPTFYHEPRMVFPSGLEATIYTADQLVHLPLDELLQDPQQPYDTTHNDIVAQPIEAYQEPAYDEYQKLAFTALTVKGFADKQVAEGKVPILELSKDMVRRTIGLDANGNLDSRILLLAHRARYMAFTLQCIPLGTRSLRVIHEINPDKDSTIVLDEWTDIAIKVRRDRYDDPAWAARLDACLPLLAETAAELDMVRNFACMTLNQIEQWLEVR